MFVKLTVRQAKALHAQLVSAEYHAEDELTRSEVMRVRRLRLMIAKKFQKASKRK